MQNQFQLRSTIANLHVEAVPSSIAKRREEQCSPSLPDGAFYSTGGVHIMCGIVGLVLPFREQCLEIKGVRCRERELISKLHHE